MLLPQLSQKRLLGSFEAPQEGQVLPEETLELFPDDAGKPYAISSIEGAFGGANGATTGTTSVSPP